MTTTPSPVKPGKEVVQFKVGTPQQLFTVHKECISQHSPSFGARLDCTHLMTLPDVKFETFEMFNDWVYMGQLWDEKDQVMRAADEPTLEAILYLYILAETLDINPLKNACVKSFMVVWNAHQDLPTGNIKDMWSKTTPDSPLRLLVQDTIASGFTAAEIRNSWDDLPSDLQLNLVQQLVTVVEHFELTKTPSQCPFDHPEKYYSL